MQLSFNTLIHNVLQFTQSVGGKIWDNVKKNKVVVAALFALCCLAAFLYARRKKNLISRVSDKPLERRMTDRPELSPTAKTQKVFEQATGQNDRHQGRDTLQVDEWEQENHHSLEAFSSPLSTPNCDEEEILDDQIEQLALPISGPIPDPIDQDPVELQKRLKDQQDNRRKLISDGVKKEEFVSNLERYIETTDDLIHLLNERAAFASSEAIQRNDPDYLSGDSFLNSLFRETEQGICQRLSKKFDISMVEFAVSNVKGQMNRMYLAHAFHKSRVSILDTSLTKDEIIDFLKDLEGSDLHKQHGASFSNLHCHSSDFSGGVLDSIFLGTPWGGPHAVDFKERNSKKVALFKEFFADDVVKYKKKLNELFISCLKDHNPELLQAFFDRGYQDQYPLSYMVKKDLSENERMEVWEQQDTNELIEEKEEHQRKLLQYLKDSQWNSHYNDYDRLKETINLLISKNFLELALFNVVSTHDLIIKEFCPADFVVLHMLESMQCDLPTLMLLARKVPPPFEFKGEFQWLMQRAAHAIANPDQFEGSLRGCQFLHDHYSQLEEELKKDLAVVLKNPAYQTIKQKYFDDLGI